MLYRVSKEESYALMISWTARGFSALLKGYQGEIMPQQGGLAPASLVCRRLALPHLFNLRG
jgi:hypothetical protein